jgi:hypothetical protein
MTENIQEKLYVSRDIDIKRESLRIRKIKLRTDNDFWVINCRLNFEIGVVQRAFSSSE